MLMKGKLISVGRKNHGFYLVPEGKTEAEKIWLNCADSTEHKTTAVQLYNFAKKLVESNKNGINVEVEGNKEQDNYYAFRLTINKANTSSVSTESSTPTAQYTCEVCGKVLKDGKYKKCYDCNEKAKVASPQSTQESIENQNRRNVIAAIVNGALISLTGQVNLTNKNTVIAELVKAVTVEVDKI